MFYNMNEIKDIVQMSQQTLMDYLENQLIDLGYEPVNENGFLYARGEIPVLLVAHLDTVHREKAEIVCFSDDLRYIMSPQGIGGDDRCGVYMIKQIIRDFKCHVLFCEDEEIGGRGATEFASSKIKPKVNFIVEMDRRGNNDAVFYGCNNPEFSEFILSFGFEERSGTFSDISVIAPYLKTAAANISSGYYNEHRTYEYIDMLAVENNIRRISQMVSVNTEHFKYVKGCPKSNQLSMFGDWGWVPMNFPPLGMGTKKRMLMEVPEGTRLITNGCEIFSESSYLIDRESKVYIYLSELNAATESERSYACDNNGGQIVFSAAKAKRLTILTMEEAIELLTN